MPNISKFSWSEVFSNTSSGKSSATAVAGIGCITVGLLCFMTGVVSCFVKCCDWGSEIIYQSLALITIGSSLLGIRKIAGFKLSKGGFDTIVDDNKKDPDKKENKSIDASQTDPSMITSDGVDMDQKLNS